MDYSLAFLAGFFGSMHCVGMCGAIVLAYSTQGMPAHVTGLSTISAHLTYNGGRVLSYGLIGAILGLLGQGLSAIRDVGSWFSLVAGIVLVLAGLTMLRMVPFLHFAETVHLSGTSRSLILRLYRKSFAALVAIPKLESKFYIGLLTPLLPCGLLYSMFFKAAETGNPLDGAMIMVFFGAGIVPSLVVTGYASSIFGQQLRRWGDRLAAITILLMGVVIVLRAVGVPLPWVPGPMH